MASGDDIPRLSPEEIEEMIANLEAQGVDARAILAESSVDEGSVPVKGKLSTLMSDVAVVLEKKEEGETSSKREIKKEVSDVKGSSRKRKRMVNYVTPLIRSERLKKKLMVNEREEMMLRGEEIEEIKVLGATNEYLEALPNVLREVESANISQAWYVEIKEELIALNYQLWCITMEVMSQLKVLLRS